ncbi:dihydroxyacetone phosphate acyltransferase [Teleopsis dalmanni]|uniref:dihydroxyacetone phosphate acyltransferase n=1 Tax=Teleopsis dalmanni TaxID=139649 RepID=UPI0018CCA3D8|nr:dihydroxyacetone phosphate acyltransferase [Teleopsis dalmanni]XP_037952282.1 dihydroxyacetone phosphate acyltransferase [Teleopsis dalmanni]XP_037952283.1 dihydroxyacetone phosphate acyltransferase [Teleopsis dalmanni]XP_037952284.1 dihydroxyacetone phosphate acyltransferase [Teleopsis dalmanni]
MKSEPPTLTSMLLTSPVTALNGGSNIYNTPVIKESTSSSSHYISNFENILAPGNEPSMTKEYKPKVAYKFEKYLNPHKLKLHVLKSEKVCKIIEHYAIQNKCSPEVIKEQVKDIINEIGLDRSLAIIRWCGIAITAIGKRISSGIYVNTASIEKVKKNLGCNPVLYLPSHRSYMDFVLMSYICFKYDIEIPGIAAGMDFHAMFGMGTMLRKTGAFFMRRSFSNDELYWDIFREYIYSLVSAYHIGVEFFIEGTRSRNFKALVPKVGLFSMALLPYFTGEVPDITIIPISISYERVLEEQLFVYELLGVPKPKESTKGFFKALKIIDENFGKMFVDFGEAISVKEFFSHTSVDRMQRASIGTHLQILNKYEIDLIKNLANEIIYQQQYRIVITTFNLISLYYASRIYLNYAPNIDELARGIHQLKSIFEELGAHVAVNMNRIKADIIETVEIHSNIVHFRNARLQYTKVAIEQLAQEIETERLKAHILKPQIMAIAVPTLALQLYINPCLFWLAHPAFLILSALQLRQEHQQKNIIEISYNDLVINLKARIAELDNIFKHEFIIESNRESEEFERNLRLLKMQGILSISKNSGQFEIYENDSSRVILSALAPFLCMYYQLAITLNKFSSEAEFTPKDVLIQMQERIESLLQENDSLYVHPYCFALDNLNIALNAFIQDDYLKKVKDTGMLRHSNGKSLKSLEDQILVYCQLMPFKQYYDATAHYSMQLMSSKL